MCALVETSEKDNKLWQASGAVPPSNPKVIPITLIPSPQIKSPKSLRANPVSSHYSHTQSTSPTPTGGRLQVRTSLDPWRQQRSLNERDLLSTGGDLRHLSQTNHRLYASADQRDRYELQLQHRERLEQYPLTRTARLDVQQRNSLNRSNHDRQFSTAGGAGAASGAAGAYRRAPPLAAAGGGGSSSSSTTSSSYYPQAKPQIVIGPGTGSVSLSASGSYDRGASMAAEAARGSGHRGLLGASRSGGGSSSVSSTEAAYWDEPATSSSSSAAQDSRRFTERRIKKTVRFDAHDDEAALLAANQALPPVTGILPSTAVDVGAATILSSGKTLDSEWSRWESERQGSQDSATKDSGIDTSSTFTSSEDSNRGDGPKVQGLEFETNQMGKNALCLCRVSLCLFNSISFSPLDPTPNFLPFVCVKNRTNRNDNPRIPCLLFLSKTNHNPDHNQATISFLVITPSSQPARKFQLF